jgi:DNA invertase Pin-like site-specific DNA recombinase
VDGTVYALVVSKANRFSRHLHSAIPLITLLNASGVRVVAVSDGLNTVDHLQQFLSELHPF